MQLLVKDKKFYHQLAAIALPIALQNLITFSVSMADTVMLGMLGEVELSAAAIANQLGFIFMLLTFGVGSGSNVMIAQFWGSRDTASIHKVITIMYRILLSAGVVFTVLALCFPYEIMSIFTPDELVIGQGVRYLKSIGWSYLMMGFSSATVIMLRSVGAVKISLLVYISSLVTNAFLNWVLIFGKLGAPALGVEGAALATCAARVVELVIVLVYMTKFEKKIIYNIRYFFAKKLGILGSFAKTSLPVVFNELIWGMGMATVAVIVGRMGREFTAAYSICGVLSQLVTVTINGVGNAAAVIIGNTVGEGEYQRAKEYGHTFMVLSLGLGLVSMCVVLLLKGPMLWLYNISDLAKHYADQIMTIFAFVVIFVAMAATSLIGVLRGGGDTRFVLLMDVIFLWCMSIPLGFLVGLKLGWAVPLVYIVIKSDEVFKSLIALVRIKQGRWINDVTKRSV